MSKLIEMLDMEFHGHRHTWEEWEKFIKPHASGMKTRPRGERTQLDARTPSRMRIKYTLVYSTINPPLKREQKASSSEQRPQAHHQAKATTPDGSVILFQAGKDQFQSDRRKLLKSFLAEKIQAYSGKDVQKHLKHLHNQL